MDLRQLRVDDLRYLLAVARTGRLVAAATALGVDHSTVSRRLRALEKVFGARLLERGADGWELTELGRAIAERARPIDDVLAEVVLAAQGRQPDALVGTFRVTAPDAFGTVFVVPALARLRADHPGLDIELITATRHLTLHQSGFDLAITVGTPVTRRLHTERLADYTLGLYACEDYLATHGTPKSVGELPDHTIVFYVDSLLQMGDLDLAQHLPDVTARFTSTNIFAQLEATAAGVGIGLLPRFMALRSPGLRELTGIGLRVRLSFTLATRRDGLSRPIAQAVRAALVEEVHARRDELLPPD